MASWIFIFARRTLWLDPINEEEPCGFPRNNFGSLNTLTGATGEYTVYVAGKELKERRAVNLVRRADLTQLDIACHPDHNYPSRLSFLSCSIHSTRLNIGTQRG